jgi:hypothetical protein
MAAAYPGIRLQEAPMPRLPALAVAPLVALAVAAAPSTAMAKEIGRVRACGADGCRVVTQRVPDESVFETGALGEGPPGPQPFVVVRVDVHDGDGSLEPAWRFAFVPGPGMIRYEAEPGVFHWGTLGPDQARAMRRVVRGVRPWPPSRFSRDLRREPAPLVRAPVAARGRAGGGGDGDGGPVPAAAAGGAALAAVGLAAVAGRRRRARGAREGAGRG